MNARIVRSVLRAAALEAWISIKRKYTSPTGVNLLIWPAIFLVVLWFLRDAEFLDLVPAGGFLLGGFLAFGIVSAAVLSVASEIQTEREDGTLLRAKAVPHGMTGHLLAKAISTPVEVILPLIPLLIGAPFIIPGTLPAEPWRWALLAAIFLLGTAAMLPWGAVFGSIFRSMLGLGIAMLGIYGVAAISGIFYPITALPSWLQMIGQLTPLYWIGLGVRRGLLPDSAAAVEIGGEWRLELVFIVLLVYAIAGLILASILLRRMARRQTGSAVAAARDRILSRGY